MYFIKAALNVALSHFRIVTLGGTLLKIIMPAYNVFFENKIRWYLAFEDDAYCVY
jgi:hypothetical protein